MSKTFVFIRHGESESNRFIHDSTGGEDVSHKINSLGDPHLTDIGERQAQATGAFLVDQLKCSRVAVKISLFTRTQQTAAPFLKLYGEFISDKHTTHELLEWTPPKKQLSQIHLDLGLIHDVDWDAFKTRVLDFADEMECAQEESITIIFGHSVYISAVFSYLASQKAWFPGLNELCFQLPNCSISTIEKTPTRWTAHYVGSIAHLPDNLVTGIQSKFGHK
jgi:broad specificity phosphatase PhoE